MNAKKLVLVVVIVFLGFWMFTDPNGLAEAARSGGAADLGPDHAAVPGDHRRSSTRSPEPWSGARP